MSSDDFTKIPPGFSCEIAKEQVWTLGAYVGYPKTDSGLSHSVIRGLVTDRLMTTPKALRSKIVDYTAANAAMRRHSVVADSLNESKTAGYPTDTPRVKLER